MTTHLVKPAVSQPVVAHPEVVFEGNIVDSQLTSQLENIIMTVEQKEVSFNSSRVKAQLAWSIGNKIGMIATRIQRLAKAGAGGEVVDTTKQELLQLLGQVAWGFEHLGDAMNDKVAASIYEWCGGGNQRGKTEKQLEEVTESLGISMAEAKLVDGTNQLRMKNYLTIRREGLAPIMENKIAQMLGKVTKFIEPSTDELQKTFQRTFEYAVQSGDYAEAKLVKADASDWLGYTPTLNTTPDQSEVDKANRIREQLDQAQRDQAAKDNAAIFEFDTDSLMADAA